MNDYKKLPIFTEIFSIVPHYAMKYFNKYCEYQYIDIDDYGEIPLQRIALNRIMSNNIGKFDITEENYDKVIVMDVLPDLQEYAKGFLIGYNTKFDTFINTIEAKKETIIRTAFKNHKSIEERHGFGVELEYLLYDAGLYEGERYKAWIIILQAPNEFVSYFLIDEQETKKQTNTKDIDEPQQQYKIKITKELENIVLENYKFWDETKNKYKNNPAYINIFDGLSQHQFLEMISNADFSELLNKSSIKQRIGYNVVVLSKIIGNKEWTEQAIKKLNNTIRNLQKNTRFAEYEALKNRFMQ